VGTQITGTFSFLGRPAWEVKAIGFLEGQVPRDATPSVEACQRQIAEEFPRPRIERRTRSTSAWGTACGIIPESCSHSSGFSAWGAMNTHTPHSFAVRLKYPHRRISLVVGISKRDWNPRNLDVGFHSRAFKSLSTPSDVFCFRHYEHVSVADLKA
jgi:hypothetical protein